jgi:Ca2+/Na+ antiporter
MTSEPVYEERVSSGWTEGLFLLLTIVCSVLLLWRMNTSGLDALGVVFLVLSVFFLFYSLNYRTLVVRLTADVLELKFGIFSWTVPLDNVQACRLDDLPTFMRYGGAGIHFMLIRGRYRVSFNFLEHPRVVVLLKRKRGPVRDVSFSTQRPDEVIRRVEAAMSASTAS